MISPFARQVLAFAVAIAMVIALKNQCRKPRWLPGRLSLWLMNWRHSGVTDWGLSHISIDKNFTILDVGCGGGRTIGKLASMASEGKVFGVDYSAQSVAVSRRANADQIARGQVDVRQASVSQLPFKDGTFDLVTAVETHYYWPDLVSDLREVRRVLKPGGKFLLIAEAYKRIGSRNPDEAAMKILGATYLTPDEHRQVLSDAGYADVEVHEELRNGWICAIGRRPMDSSRN